MEAGEMDMYLFIQKNRDLLLTILIALFTLAASGFLLFHIAAEGITIVIAVLIFLYSRKVRSNNSFVLLLGSALAVVGVIDFFHVLTYYGMGVLIKDNANKATQLWLAGRYILSVTLLFAPSALKKEYSQHIMYLIFVAAAMLMLSLTFFYQELPVCLTPAHGLTSFKIYSEYGIILLLGLALYRFYRKRESMNPYSHKGIQSFLAVFIISEICFTLYIDVFSIIGVLGHMFKVLEYVLLYYAIIANDPNDLNNICISNNT